MKAFVIAVGIISLFSSTLLLAESIVDDTILSQKLDHVIHNPLIDVRLESRPDGFILRMQSKNPESQEAARAFAVEVIKQHNLSHDVPQTNGYGLPEQ
ncbi:MAG TPA: hypothetical protein VE954_26665 [Oligoflexus sp.]|uniref:hypothetical protein n=1 Tax=Oligoflexus sp. TaxID=1971216 RepID=UPI002D26EE33|nr:hypothetical protein [Oligoflexus sp.]HYX36709.1 hypothetical protein [Oligoflexus sp.]